MAPQLDIVIVSHGDGCWLDACLRSLEQRSGGCEYRVVIVENSPDDDDHPDSVMADTVRVLHTPNHGFAAANNAGLALTTAERVLFLNPDTELREGTLAAMCEALDARPEVGLLAVRQVNPRGELDASIRRFPCPSRAFAQSLWSERWPLIGRAVGERVLDPAAYERVTECDWTTGAVMLVRRTALAESGAFDERFFLYSEETDLCRRITTAGWRVLHVPSVTFLHHARKAGVDPRREAQMVFARLQYAEKHFGRLRRSLYRVALALGHVVRIAVLSLRTPTETSSSEASRACLKVLAGLSGSPFVQATGAELNRSSA